MMPLIHGDVSDPAIDVFMVSQVSIPYRMHDLGHGGERTHSTCYVPAIVDK